MHIKQYSTCLDFILYSPLKKEKKGHDDSWPINYLAITIFLLTFIPFIEITA
jgi:hypothetical protein